MAGTRTAPAFTAAAQTRMITLHLVDASGDPWAEEWRVPVAATAIAIEAWAAAYQGASQLNLWKITDQQIRLGQKQPASAQALNRSSSKDGINILVPNTATFVSRTQRLVGPITDVMDGNTDNPLPGSAELTALTTAITDVGFGTTGDYIDSMQFTEQRERKNNARVPA